MYVYCDSLKATKQLVKMMQSAGFAVAYISHEAFKASEVPIPETVIHFSAVITLTVQVKPESRTTNSFTVRDVTDMAKTAAAKFGKIEKFTLVDGVHYQPSGLIKFEVEYDSVADAFDSILNTNQPSGDPTAYATFDVSASSLYLRLISHD